MDLEKVAAVIRPRSYWESVDLGFCLVRAWRRPLFEAWLLTFLPVSAAVAALLFEHPSIALLVIWWLKPLLDRIPLLVLSRGLFGSPPTRGEVLAALPGLWRRNLVTALLVYRLDPARAFNLSVWELERLSGRARRARSTVLEKGCYGEACNMTAICALFELCLCLGILAFAATMIPPGYLSRWFRAMVDLQRIDVPLYAQWAMVSAYLLAMMVVEPFYIAGGFGLYINRRTRLEAWDVEIAFRRMSRRLAPALVLIGLALGAVAAPAWAQDPPSAIPGAGPPVAVAPERPGPGTRDPAQVIQDVLRDPEFGGVKRVKVWRLKDRAALENAVEAAPSPFLLELGRAVAAIVQPVLWGLLIVALAYLLIRARRKIPEARRSRDRSRPAPPEILSGLDIRPESLPADIAGTARRLQDEGKPAESMSLLYRGALARLAAVEGLPLKKSFTEGDCLDVVARKVAPERARYFRILTETWQAAAYGRRMPDPSRADSLIRGWPLNFGAASKAAP
jgi:uncharacterized protein DUF4129